jgi:hypothetical protein
VPSKRALAAALCLSPLIGCSGGTPPRFDLVSARTLERSDEGQVIVLTFRGENPNDYEIDLRRANYRVLADGVEIFHARQSAEAGLPRYGRVDMELLAAFPLEKAPPEGSTISVNGSVEYLTPGPFVETLYDNHVRRPTAKLRGSAPLAN